MSAYPNQTPNLGNLNFDDIKDSLKTYLKNQDNLKDFNFEGSVLQTLLNVLAYNTYYYAFYSNMVANEVFLDSAQRIDSIISLVKPLGYFIPFKTSSKATLNVYGLVNDIPEYAQFRGIDSDGLSFYFYTIKSYQQSDSDALNVEIYEAKNLYKDVDVTGKFDFTKQRFFVEDTNIDVNTLKVKVRLDGINRPGNPLDAWILADTLGNVDTTNQNVYYLERANNGLYVIFGKDNALGNKLTIDSDQIFIDYLSTSGSIANDIIQFSFVSPANIAGNLNIELVEKSMGGLDSPDLDLIKFVAPRSFSAQNRAVTKDDIKALIAPFFNSLNEFSVYGGEEIYPQMYGRVFFAADLDPNNPADLQKIQKIYNLIKNKCMVTLTPEYTKGKTLPVKSAVSFKLNSTRQYTQQELQQIRNDIKNVLNTNYDTTGSYNYSFISDDVISNLKLRYKDLIIDPSDFIITYNETIYENGPININFENEIDIPYFTNYDITGEYQNSLNQTIKLVAYIPLSQNLFNFVNLRTYLKQDDETFILSPIVNGRINIKKGILEIYDDRFLDSPVPINIKFKNSYFTSILNNKIKFTTDTVEYR